jgi:hypothetical protein
MRVGRRLRATCWCTRNHCLLGPVDQSRPAPSTARNAHRERIWLRPGKGRLHLGARTMKMSSSSCVYKGHHEHTDQAILGCSEAGDSGPVSMNLAYLLPTGNRETGRSSVASEVLQISVGLSHCPKNHLDGTHSHARSIEFKTGNPLGPLVIKCVLQVVENRLVIRRRYWACGACYSTSAFGLDPQFRPWPPC